VFDSTVSVVIPTVNRPAMLLRALDSVMRQTHLPIEIIVVLDGPNDLTLAALQGRDHVRVLELKAKSGACVARNFGVKNARAAWIAFLDDDDEWLPQKLERQVRAGLRSSLRYPIVFSQVIVNTPKGRFLMPRRGPARLESVDEYLYCRKSLLPGEVFFHTSNLLAPRELLDRVEFRLGQRKWDDVDWLLRAAKIGGAGLEFLPEPLSIYNSEDYDRSTVSSAFDWKYLFDWATSNRNLFSPRAYSGVFLVNIMHEAVRQRDCKAILPLAREARIGKPDLIQSVLFMVGLLALSIVPRSTYDRVKIRLRNRLPTATSHSLQSP
jgi:glycosyltransferase involved in cell wall biosynthesis